MADIYKAYQTLNKALGLKLTHEEIVRVEKMAKGIIGKGQGFSANNLDDMEAFVYFKPRKTKRRSK